MKPPKQKTVPCKKCRTRITPKGNSSLNQYCTAEPCQDAKITKALEKGRQAIKKQVKETNKEHRVWRKEAIEKLKTHKDYLNELQVIFNTYIRLRDIGKGCITCGRDLSSIKFDAGHYYSVGSAPELRFNEDNCQGQCVHCNQHNHGRLIEYSECLPKRIGWERFSILQDKKGVSNKYSIDELKAKAIHYKMQIKILKEK